MAITFHLIKMNYLSLYFLLLISILTGCSSNPGTIVLAKNGEAKITVALPSEASVSQQFAADELVKYLHKISDADFLIDTGTTENSPKITLSVNTDLKTESYSITADGSDIFLTGGSNRAVLYAVYDFLHRLGCQWLSPKFSFYKGKAEFIPHKSSLIYDVSHNIQEQPVFAYRKLDVEEGRTHNTQNLLQLIDWMPKLRFNTLMVPLDYGGNGRVQWDKWRKELTPELKKRGLMIEVGGHGYQNFLNANMIVKSQTGEEVTLFQQHPDWFGKDKNCNPSPAEYLVFNTSDQDAVNYFMDNILNYIREHPEIDIFDFWPPDGAHWAECPAFSALGSSQDRQARLANQVDSAIKKIRPDMQLEIIAYARALLPPENVSLNEDILVDFCPIDQSFEKQINNPSAENNANYVHAIRSWRKNFSGNISLYSYYRKYAWRSLPNIIPHYMQRDMQWYAKVPLQGISIYSEPGDWGTYELNYYTLGHLAWNPNCYVDSLINQFYTIRFGSDWKAVKEIYTSLENIVRKYSSIPFTELKPAQQISKAEKELEKHINKVQNIMQKSSNESLSRLLLMLKYAAYDLKIQERIASGNKREASEIIKDLVAFLENNRNKGVFVLSAKNNLSKYMKHYDI